MVNKKISDHHFFAGSGAPTFPKGNKVQHHPESMSVGGMHDYPDNSEAIHSTQNQNAAKVNGFKQKKDHRN
jgi:hypothetical protein